MNVNSATLIGRVTKTPELKVTPGGTPVTKFSLATNHTYKDKNGDKKEMAQFHNCVAWGKTAEVINQYVTKGQELYVCGRIEYRSWDKQDGTKGYMTEIIVDQFQFGAKPKTDSPAYDDHAQQEGKPMERSAVDVLLESERVMQGNEIRLEDIPF